LRWYLARCAVVVMRGYTRIDCDGVYGSIGGVWCAVDAMLVGDAVRRSLQGRAARALAARDFTHHLYIGRYCCILDIHHYSNHNPGLLHSDGLTIHYSMIFLLIPLLSPTAPKSIPCLPVLPLSRLPPSLHPLRPNSPDSAIHLWRLFCPSS
jgi:hypothetical protein